MDDHLALHNAAVIRVDSRAVWLARTDRHAAQDSKALPIIQDIHDREEFQAAMFAAARTGERQHIEVVLADATMSVAIEYLPTIEKFGVSLFSRPRLPDLTERQAALLKLLRADRTIAQMAVELRITESTVQSHLKSMRDRLGFETNWGMAASEF